MSVIETETATTGEYPQIVRVRTHTLNADAPTGSGGADGAPGPHDYFDVALATCKAITATWYAKRHSIPLERVETHVESDAAQERAGVYKLLMTTSEVQIETVMP